MKTEATDELLDLIGRLQKNPVALSVRQPWPHRMFYEGKDIENRDWPIVPNHSPDPSARVTHQGLLQDKPLNGNRIRAILVA